VRLHTPGRLALRAVPFLALLALVTGGWSLGPPSIPGQSAGPTETTHPDPTESFNQAMESLESTQNPLGHAVKCNLGATPMSAKCGLQSSATPVSGNTSFGFEQSLVSPSAPPQTTGASLAWDTVDHEAVLFGGTGTSGLSNTTWVFRNATWTNITDPALAPPARTGAAMAFDNQSDEIVLFGGCGVTQCPLADSWSFLGGRWANETTSFTATGAPPIPTYDSAVANLVNTTDPSDGSVVVFGGCLLAGCASQTNATQELELSGSCPGFAEQIPCWVEWHGPSPSARAGAAAAFQPGGSRSPNQVVLYGGFESPGAAPLRDLNDTWSFDGAAWNPVTTAAGFPYPSSGRSFASMFYYAWPGPGGELFLYGGYNHTTGTPYPEIWDLTVYNTTAGGGFMASWENYSLYISQPPAQLQPAFASTALAGTADDSAAVLVGDGSIGTGTSDTWVFETAIELRPTATPTPVETNASVALVAGESGGTLPYSASWTFGDGQSGVGLTAAHNYTAAGNYTATVQVTDAWGIRNSSNLTVPVRLPTINLTLPPGIDANQSVVFSASLVNGTPSAGPQKYNITWSFPAHRPTPGAQVSVTFSTPGPKVCSVVVIDATGTRVALGFTVAVNPALVATPTYAPSNPQAGGNVSFEPNAGGGTPPYTFYWAFGDGASSNVSTPIHAYARTNTYTVSVWVNDSIGASVERTFSVEVGKVSTPFVFDWSRSGWLIVAILVVVAVVIAFVILGRRKQPPVAEPTPGPARTPIARGTPPGGEGTVPPGPPPPGAPPPAS
jgi:hypothetical protein